jgi:drug/metabolite transporter (DMT)-like permease
MTVTDDPTPAAGPSRRSVLTTSEGTHKGAFTPLDWALFTSIGLIWGSSFLFIAIGLDAFAPGLVTWLRVLFGAAVLWTMPRSRTTPLDRADRPRIVAVSFLWVAIPFTLFPLAEQHIASGLTGLINGALPIFVATIGSLMRRRLPARTQLVGLGLGFAGIALIALPAAGEGSSEALGVVMALVAVACYGVASNIAGPLTERYGSIPVMARMVGLAAIWTAPFGLWSLPSSTFAWGSFFAVAALGMLGTGLAFAIMGQLVARVGPTRAAFAIYFVPVVALILGAVFRDETIVISSVIGVALVIAGAMFASRKVSR